MAMVSSAAAVILALSTASAAAPAPPPEKVIARIDLSKPFHLAAEASFAATQGRPVKDGLGDMQPGGIRVCVRPAVASLCTTDRKATLPDLEYNYLEIVEIVYPRGSSAPPLLHLQLATMRAPNGSQAHAAVMVAYRPAKHQFEPVFKDEVGGNHNQQIRYIAGGLLRGDMITAEPTENAPYGYWVTLNQLGPGYHYRRVLRYRSATHYGDGNPLAVIDSEMPNILLRLGLWHPGEPLPLPKSGCAHPHLVNTELWCS